MNISLRREVEIMERKVNSWINIITRSSGPQSFPLRNGNEFLRNHTVKICISFRVQALEQKGTKHNELSVTWHL